MMIWIAWPRKPARANCAAHFPVSPRRVLRSSAIAQLQIIGQALRTKVHATKIPCTNLPGDRM